MHDRMLEDLSEPEPEHRPAVRVTAVTTPVTWEWLGDCWAKVFEKPIFPDIGREE